jgi:hypothetical protein
VPGERDRLTGARSSQGEAGRIDELDGFEFGQARRHVRGRRDGPDDVVDGHQRRRAMAPGRDEAQPRLRDDGKRALARGHEIDQVVPGQLAHHRSI